MTDYERVEKVIRYLERHYLEQPSLTKLAQATGLSASHFHRLFSRWAGTTPKEFIKFLTVNHAKKLLLESRDLLSASLDSGLSGPGRLHDLFVSVEALTPGEFKAKGGGVEIEYGFHSSPFGDCLIGMTQRGVCHLSFRDENSRAVVEEMKAKWPNATFKKNASATKEIARDIFRGRSGRRIHVLLSGTPFQIKVWEALLRIPPGHVAAYSDIARALDSPEASRAVGNAIGNNSIAYLIPCHRVIRESGAFGNYRWGPIRKQSLLAWEAARNRQGLCDL